MSPGCRLQTWLAFVLGLGADGLCLSVAAELGYFDGSEAFAVGSCALVFAATFYVVATLGGLLVRSTEYAGIAALTGFVRAGLVVLLALVMTLGQAWLLALSLGALSGAGEFARRGIMRHSAAGPSVSEPTGGSRRGPRIWLTVGVLVGLVGLIVGGPFEAHHGLRPTSYTTCAMFLLCGVLASGAGQVGAGTGRRAGRQESASRPSPNA